MNSDLTESHVEQISRSKWPKEVLSKISRDSSELLRQNSMFELEYDNASVTTSLV